MKDRQEMQGGEVVVQALVANGVDVLFGIPGVQLDPIFAALHDVQDKIRIIHPRHEQGAALMAFGYSHVTRKVGTLLVVPGPGFLNATTGILTAHGCNAPLLCLVGQSERMFINSGVGVLHELENQIGIARSLTKWAERVEDPKNIIPLLNSAIEALRTDRPRPVYLELPSDIVRMDVEVETPFDAAFEARKNPQIDQELIEKTAQALANSKAPLIMAGGGAVDAGEAIQQLAEMLKAPVGMSENGLGTVDCRHPLAFTQMGANKHWGKADVVLALGTRLFAPIYNWGWDEDMSIFKVDIDASELNRLPAPMQGVLGEIEEVVTLLCEALPKYLSNRADNSKMLESVREEVKQDLSSMGFHRQLMEIIREEIGEEGILVSDVTQLNHAGMDMFPVYKPRTYISSGYQGTLGFGPCTALGVKVGKPDVPVVCLVGDGGFMYAAQELATAVQFNIPVIMLVMNDGAYKNVEGLLNNAYGGRAVATDLINPDFLKFAESFGVKARRVTTPGEMQSALHDLIAENVPAVIDYQVSDFPPTFWLRFLPQVRENIPENKHALVKK